VNVSASAAASCGMGLKPRKLPAASTRTTGGPAPTRSKASEVPSVDLTLPISVLVIVVGSFVLRRFQFGRREHHRHAPQQERPVRADGGEVEGGRGVIRETLGDSRIADKVQFHAGTVVRFGPELLIAQCQPGLLVHNKPARSSAGGRSPRGISGRFFDAAEDRQPSPSPSPTNTRS